MALRRNALYLAWLVAVVATLGSLYFSEIEGYIPCDLCWFQRILMYPLSVILGIAAFYNEHTIRKYVLPLSIVGMGISTFHYMMEKIPGFKEIRPCTQGVPCTTEWINWLGFITIPFLALTGFTLITILLFIAKKDDND
ncbi:disulfide oxidoreductase [Paenibacillus sp. LHD-117]|uniref:disulfide oxidoreductase n=1 Tax=Paenibacillus sp. LHD-117 TaxID=3071412 RepID=UPI0027DEFC94|nr:disulfide oxidoreductase [Paenibacillus sp. LHD-117]MDQ6419795.1 disulfide oxidoreductase [Paenibacillus sp. LHD-117]